MDTWQQQSPRGQLFFSPSTATITDPAQRIAMTHLNAAKEPTDSVASDMSRSNPMGIEC